MKKIVAIGGGDSAKSLEAIDREIIRLSGKKRPRYLFIPTASLDEQPYTDLMLKTYGDLGCDTDVLYLIKEKLSRDEIAKKISSADIIYVGGGNTLKMMRLWRHLGVDRMLKAAHACGVVMCGVSAGSICWFDSGHSDSMSYYNPIKWKYINVRGLGLVKGVHCPHYNGATLKVPRRKRFQEMMDVIGGLGIAIENHCAVEFIDNTYRVLTTKPDVAACRGYKQNGNVISEKVAQALKFSPISNLYAVAK